MDKEKSLTVTLNKNADKVQVTVENKHLFPEHGVGEIVEIKPRGEDGSANFSPPPPSLR